MNRRTVLAGACSCGFVFGAQPASAQQDPDVQGCRMREDAYDRRIAPTARSFTYGAANGASNPSSGDKLFDQALAVTLANLSNMFGVLPAFSFYDDGNSPNAWASTRQTRSNRPDGSVAYGQSFLKAQLDSGPAGPSQVLGVCAHEFAHILQFKRNAMKTLEPPGQTGFRVEIHADYLAGYFAGSRKLERESFPAAEVALFVHSLGDYNTSSDGHHGTPQQRGEAVRQGFLQAYEQKASFSEAYDAGMRFALSL